MLSVWDLFDEDEIVELMALAKLQIVRAFAQEREFIRGKMRCTDNYIYGVDNLQSELARYVARQTHRHFIAKEMLPYSVIEDVPDKFIDGLIFTLQYELILMQINVLCSKPLFKIYFNERYGIWQATQSMMDEYHAVCNKARRQPFVDARNFHGKVRSQVLRRGMAPGASVSMA